MGGFESVCFNWMCLCRTSWWQAHPRLLLISGIHISLLHLHTENRNGAGTMGGRCGSSLKYDNLGEGLHLKWNYQTPSAYALMSRFFFKGKETVLCLEQVPGVIFWPIFFFFPDMRVSGCPCFQFPATEFTASHPSRQCREETGGCSWLRVRRGDAGGQTVLARARQAWSSHWPGTHPRHQACAFLGEPQHRKSEQSGAGWLLAFIHSPSKCWLGTATHC